MTNKTRLRRDRCVSTGEGSRRKFSGVWPRTSFILLSPRRKWCLYAMVLSFCLLMLIMLIIRSFACRQCVLVGQWPSSAIVFCLAIRTTDVPYVSSTVKNFTSVHASGGGLLMAPINVLQDGTNVSTLQI